MVSLKSYSFNTNLSVGIPLSDLDAIDARLLKTLRDNNLDDMLCHVPVFM
jgi:hypothetical protein